MYTECSVWVSPEHTLGCRPTLNTNTFWNRYTYCHFTTRETEARECRKLSQRNRRVDWWGLHHWAQSQGEVLTAAPWDGSYCSTTNKNTRGWGASGWCHTWQGNLSEGGLKHTLIPKHWVFPLNQSAKLPTLLYLSSWIYFSCHHCFWYFEPIHLWVFYCPQVNMDFS